jgi:aspartate-semialdehyde dehydrogenase
MNRNPHVAVVGPTGAVGVEMIKTLEKRNFPAGKLTLLASARSAGRKLKFRGQEIEIRELRKDSFTGIDIALFSAGGSISKEFAPVAAKAGCIVIDNSSAFSHGRLRAARYSRNQRRGRAPAQGHHRQSQLHDRDHAHGPLSVAPGIRRAPHFCFKLPGGVWHGRESLEELQRQVEQIVEGKPVTKEVYPHQIAFNVLPHVDSFLPSGYTKEEMKMENEGRKIMHHPTFRASVTCVRVPVYRAHAVAVNAEFDKHVTPDAARDVLLKAPGLDVVDNPEKKEYPLPLYAAEKYNCQVGRIRQDCALDNGICFWVAGDQLLKGAALNAVQIAEELLK